MTWLKFSHMALACKDLAATERFYSRHFGFRRSRAFPVGATEIIYIKSGDMYLELFQSEGERPEGTPTGDGPKWPSFRHLAFQVDDVDAKVAAMGADAHVTLGPLDFGAFLPGWRTVWLADPDGNIVEISQGYSDPTEG